MSPINHMGRIVSTTTHVHHSHSVLSKQIEILKQTLLIQKNVPIPILLESNQSDINEMVHMDTRSRILVGLERDVFHQTGFLRQNSLVFPLVTQPQPIALNL